MSESVSAAVTCDGDAPSTNNDKRFRCSTCNRLFSKADHLSRHSRSHLKHKPFACPKCGKSFGRQDVLSRHKKIHDIQQDSNPTPWPTPSADGLIDTTMDSSAGGFSQQSSYNSMSPLEQDSLSQPVLEDAHSWSDSGDMLEFLLSDFTNNWPLSLPVMQFEATSSAQALLNPSLPGPAQQTGPGHFAMHQMSKLISDLSSTLVAEIEATGITSAFLDTCIHVFFEKFIPAFPVLHKATFAVKESSHPLMLNIIALGSLFVGAKDALPKGEALWKLAHTAVATSWQALMATKGPHDDCNGVQLVLTALLGQTYAILSKNESLRTTSQVFHGLGFYWARQCGMYNTENFPTIVVPARDAPESHKIEAWKSWAAREVMKRAILGHYVLDGQISEFSGHPACTRHVTNSLPTPAPESVFAAPTVDDWIMEVERAELSSHSFREVFVSLFSREVTSLESSLSNFSVRVSLEGLQSLASDIQQADGPSVGTPSKIEIALALVKLQTERLSLLDMSVENMELLVRWHAICLNLATQSTTLCQQLCGLYDIHQQLHQQARTTSLTFSLHVWCQSVDGLRALLHALAIQDLVERLPFGRSLAIHLPAAIFAVTTIYSARCLAGLPTIAVPKAINWQEVWEISGNSASAVNAFLEKNSQAFPSRTSTRNLIYDLNSLQIMLGSISLRWGVSHAMDDILHRWITIANENIQPSV